MSALLEVQSLRKAYGERVVLHDISLSVAPHDVICLIGSSGSGKSTLLRCLNLLEEIQDGVIVFDGREISDPRVDPRAVRRDIGMVFQAYNLFPHLTVLDNCTLAQSLVHKVAKREARSRALELLERFGLGDKAAADGLAESKSLTDGYLKTLAEHGMKVAPPSDKLKQELKGYGETMTQEWLKQAGPDGKAIIDAYKAM